MSSLQKIDPDLQLKLEEWALWDFLRCYWKSEDIGFYTSKYAELTAEIEQYNLGQQAWEIKYYERERLKTLEEREIWFKIVRAISSI